MWQASALLARWFRFQPSEIDRLDLDDFLEWVRQANRQIEELNSQDQSE